MPQFNAYPALSIQQNQQSPLDMYMKLVQLRQLVESQRYQQQMQPMQLQAQQLQLQQLQRSQKSQDAIMKAYTESQGDLDKTIPLAAKYGAIPDHLIALKQKALESDKATLELYKAKGQQALWESDLMQGAHDAVGALPSEQRPQAYQQQLQQLQKAGVDVSQVSPEYPGDQMFDLMGLGLQSHAKRLEEIAKQSEIRKNLGQAQEAEARASELGGFTPDKIDQLNRGLEQRWQVLNPSQPLPSSYTLPQTATGKDFDRIDKLMQQTEQAKGTKAQQDTATAIRQQTFSLMSGRQNQARSDRSYTYNNNQLDALQTPIEALNGRMSRLQASLDQNTPQADALVAPELLTVMAGGQGSGLRMNEAEISRIIGGRSNWESLKAAVNKWQLDPSKATSITPAQRSQIRALVQEVQKRVSAQSAVLNDARDQLNNTDDPAEHRQIVADVRRKLSGSSGAQTGTNAGPQQGYVRIQASDGSLHDLPRANLGAARQRDPGLKVVQ